MISTLAEELSKVLVIKHTFLELIAEGGEEERPDDNVQRALSAPAGFRSVQGTDADVAAATGQKLTRIASPERTCAQDEVADAATHTTVVLRNLPHTFHRQDVLDVFDKEGFSGCYDFVYLPIDAGAQSNFGYAFVNLLSRDQACRFLAHFDGFCRWEGASSKAAIASWSRSQGLQDHVESYRNRPVMHDGVPDEYKPIVLKNGVRVPFPAPTRKVPTMRRLRTRRGWKRSQGAKESPLQGGLEECEVEGADSTDVLTTSAGEATESDMTDAAGFRFQQFTFDKETVDIDGSSECSTRVSCKSGSSAPLGCTSQQPEAASMLAGGLISTKAPLAGGLLLQPGCVVEVPRADLPAGQRAVVCGAHAESYLVQLLKDGIAYGPAMKIRAEQVRPVLAGLGAHQ